MAHFLIYSLFLVVANWPVYNFAICPHEDTSLKQWSKAKTWPNGKPKGQSPVVITEPVLLDEQPPELHSINITSTGRLVWSADVDIALRVKYIYIYGRMDIGSEECPFTGPAKITLIGRRGEFNFKDDFDLLIGDKVIVAENGGTLEIHGKPKLPWTKLTKTVPKLSSETGLLFDHLESENSKTQKYENGIVAYIFQIDTSGKVTVKQFGSFELLSTWQQPKEKDRFITFLNNVDKGDVLAMGIRYNLYPNGAGVGNIDAICDEFETLFFGQVTGSSTMRDIQNYDAYSAIVEKKSDGTVTVIEDITKFINAGEEMLAKSFLFQLSSKTKVSVESYTRQSLSWESYLNIRVISLDGAYPKLNVLDDASTWQLGDKVVLTSTDYDWQQAEEATIVECTDCLNNEIRVDLEVKYVHWGEMLAYNRLDERGEVALLTRNIVIEGEVEDACVESNGNCDKFDQDTLGGHFKFLRGSTVHVEGAELYHMGQQTDKGRYPLHFHMGLDMRDMEHPPYLKENSIHHCFSRCVTVHGTHGVLVKDNVCFDTLGHAFFIEDGGERDTVFDGNLAANVRKGSLLPSDDKPTCFWITSPLTKLVNNVAAGGESHGIWYIFPEEPIGPSKGLGFFQPLEADSTPLLEFDNNVVHSQKEIAFTLDKRLSESESDALTDLDDATGNNNYLPKVNPLDPNSEAAEVRFTRLTAFKSKNIAWLRGGWLHITLSSFADTKSALVFASRRVINQNQFLTDSIMVGLSDNLGEPVEGFNRSLPVKSNVNKPIQGYVVYDGPELGENVWFDGFQSTSFYSAAAIGFKRNNIFRSSAINGLRNVQFGFIDGVTGNRMYDGDLGDEGFARETGDKVATYRDYDGSLTGRPGYQIVKPWPFYVTPECTYRENWNMAICPDTYGKLQLWYKSEHSDLTLPLMVRDDLPTINETQFFNNTIDFLLILGGSKTYTLHFTEYIPPVLVIGSDGIERDKNMRFGVCLPLDAKFNLVSELPMDHDDLSDWTIATSLEELDATLDGSKYYHDPETGMLYLNFASDLVRTESDSNMCPGSDECPGVKIEILEGDLYDADCRSRLYSTTANGDNRKIDLPLDTKYLGSVEQPPSNWGAGPTKPFPNRIAGEDRWTKK